MGCDRCFLVFHTLRMNQQHFGILPLEGRRTVVPWGASCVAQVWKARGGIDYGQMQYSKTARCLIWNQVMNSFDTNIAHSLIHP